MPSDPPPVDKKKWEVGEKNTSAVCPQCGRTAPRRGTGTRKPRDLRDSKTGRPVEIEIAFPVYECKRCCRGHFNEDLAKWGIGPKRHYTKRVVDLAIHLVKNENMSLRGASRKLLEEHFVRVPHTTIQHWIADLEE